MKVSLFYLIHTANSNSHENLVFSRDFSAFYPTALNGCWGIVFTRGIVFTHGVRMVGRAAGNSLSGLYLRNRKV